MLRLARRGQGGAAGAGHRPAAVVHAAGVLLRRHRARDRDAQRASAVRGGGVRARAEQRRRDRGAARAAPGRERAPDRHERPARTRRWSCSSASGPPPASSPWRSCCCPRSATPEPGSTGSGSGATRRSASSPGCRAGPSATSRRTRSRSGSRCSSRTATAATRPSTSPRSRSSSCPHGLFAVSIMTALAPELASRASRGDFDGLRDQFAMGFRLMGLVVHPRRRRSSLVLARPIVNALLDYGSFTARERRRDRGDARLVRDRALLVLRVPLHAARLLRDAGHPDAVPAQLPRERHQHRARVRALPGVRRPGTRALVVDRVHRRDVRRRSARCGSGSAGSRDGASSTRWRACSSRPRVLARARVGRRDGDRLRDAGPGDRRDDRGARRRRRRLPRHAPPAPRRASSACCATPSAAARSGRRATTGVGLSAARP